MSILEKWFENLREIREELLDIVKTVTDGELNWVPRPGMKSVKALLIEIAAGELWLNHFLIFPGVPFTWESAFEMVKGGTLKDVLTELETIRSQTIQLFQQYTEKELFEEKPWPNDPSKTYSPEETIRYLMQHEYYHLGQIIYNRWMLGYNPYDSDEASSG